MPVLGCRYRGALEVVALSSSPPSLRLVNHLDVEEYLRGMGEVLDPSWPPASLRAQAIAARTYALRVMAGAGEICADARCQVYLGQQVEYAAMDRAVADTAGQVLTFGGKLAAAVYSANGGGKSANREEGFGSVTVGPDESFPYLRSADYLTHDRLPWSVTIPLDAVAASLDYPGDVSSVTIERVGPSGRVLDVAVDGSAGPRTLSGIDFAAGLGLRSTLFRPRVGTAPGIPPVPVPSADPLRQGVGVRSAPSSSAKATDAHPAARSDTESTDPGAAGSPRALRLLLESLSMAVLTLSSPSGRHRRSPANDHR